MKKQTVIFYALFIPTLSLCAYYMPPIVYGITMLLIIGINFNGMFGDELR